MATFFLLLRSLISMVCPGIGTAIWHKKVLRFHGEVEFFTTLGSSDVYVEEN